MKNTKSLRAFPDDLNATHKALMALFGAQTEQIGDLCSRLPYKQRHLLPLLRTILLTLHPDLTSDDILDETLHLIVCADPAAVVSTLNSNANAKLRDTLTAAQTLTWKV